MKFSLILIPLSFSPTLIHAKGLWASTPASSDVVKDAYPVGNGRLGGARNDKPFPNDGFLTIGSYALRRSWS
jgi:hypothetical protein